MCAYLTTDSHINDLPLNRERRARCSLYPDRPAARRLQRLVRQRRVRTATASHLCCAGGLDAAAKIRRDSK